MHRRTTPALRLLTARTTLLAATLSAALLGCGGSDTPPSNKICTTADVDALFAVGKGNCSVGGCHDAQGTAGNFSMTGDWHSRLVGMTPKGGGAIPSMCGSGGAYLVPGSTPATGLFLNKLSASPSCGVRMPMSLGQPLTAAEMACVQSWANTLTAGSSGAADGGTGG